MRAEGILIVFFFIIQWGRPLCNITSWSWRELILLPLEISICSIFWKTRVMKVEMWLIVAKLMCYSLFVSLPFCNVVLWFVSSRLIGVLRLIYQTSRTNKINPLQLAHELCVWNKYNWIYFVEWKKCITFTGSFQV